MSSDSSDEENLQLLKEAIDPQFINDSMFNDRQSCSAPVGVSVDVKEALPSLRTAKDADEQFNFFRVTPEFRNYVSRHLSEALEKKLQKSLTTSVENTADVPRKKQRKAGVKLFKNSTKFLKATTWPSKTQVSSRLPILHKKSRDVVSEESIKSLAVTPEYIQSRAETLHWSKRSKAPVYHYTKASDGTLVLKE